MKLKGGSDGRSDNHEGWNIYVDNKVVSFDLTLWISIFTLLYSINWLQWIDHLYFSYSYPYYQQPWKMCPFFGLKHFKGCFFKSKSIWTSSRQALNLLYMENTHFTGNFLSTHLSNRLIWYDLSVSNCKLDFCFLSLFIHGLHYVGILTLLINFKTSVFFQDI